MTIEITEPKALQEYCNKERQLGKQLGYVPTMGNLHAGHISLLKRSVLECERTILSIFVNPTQFNQSTDLDNYPRTLERDMDLARQAGVDVIFTPSYQALYPDNYQYKVIETQLSQLLEGKKRPGHFDGVLTVVLKLLLLIRPQQAYFGKKDLQQVLLLQGMIDAFFLETKITACETVRETNKLAFSSRNNLISSQKDRQLAPQLYRLLSSDKNCKQIYQELTQLGFKVDYIEEYQQHRFGAAYLGDVRLIDNVRK